MEGSNFLDKKYPNLTGSKPVERAVKKAKNDPERKVAPHTRDERIQAYLDRIDKIVENERGWELLKSKIIKEFVIDTEDEDTLTKIAHGLYESEKRLAIERGQGAQIAQITEEENILKQYKGLAKEKRDIQERTIKSWLDYLEKNDSQHPVWFRYFVVRNLEKMGTLDKEKGEYTKRTDHTIAPFPEINSEALGFVYRMLTTGIGHQEFTDAPEKREELAKIIAKKDFIKLYTFAQIETAGTLNRESIKGEWVKYSQGSDYHKLENALRGKGTGWCTAEGSAYAHLQGGDFYVYYTLGTGGKYTEPRIAIRMEGEQIAEVRGVNHRQELEPMLVDIATQKYGTLPGGDKFDKKSHDMKKVTELTKKQEKGEPFTKDDLLFLYEINSPIEGFGYDRDPRIEELSKVRNSTEDLPIIFECQPREVAHSVKEIKESTKVYVGDLEPGVFQKLSRNFEHIYTRFPRGRIKKEYVEIDEKNLEELEMELEKSRIVMTDSVVEMLGSKYLIFSTPPGKATLVRLTLIDMGIDYETTLDQIYFQANKLGLKLCPAEVAIYFRLQYQDQPMDEYINVGMKPIPDNYGELCIFELRRDPEGLCLGYDLGDYERRFRPDHEFIFLLPKGKS